MNYFGSNVVCDKPSSGMIRLNEEECSYLLDLIKDQSDKRAELKENLDKLHYMIVHGQRMLGI